MVDFQPLTLTTTDLGSVAYSYGHLLTQPALPSYCPMSRLPCCLFPSYLHTGSSAHPGVTRPRFSIPRKLRPLPPLTCHQYSLTLPPLSCPNHACHITVSAAPTLLPKYLLVWSSSAVQLLSNTTTSHATSPRPHTSSLSNKPRRLGGRATHYVTISCLILMYSQRAFPLASGVLSLPPPFSKYCPPASDP